MFVTASVAFLMVGSAGLAHRGSRLAAEILVAASGLSLLVNKPVEMAILWTVAPDRGLTIADLVGFAGAGYGALMMRRLGTANHVVRGRASIDDLLIDDVLIDVRTADRATPSCEATDRQDGTPAADSPDTAHVDPPQPPAMSARSRFLQARRRGSAA